MLFLCLAHSQWSPRVKSQSKIRIHRRSQVEIWQNFNLEHCHLELVRDYHQSLWIEYDDLKATLDSQDREALRCLLQNWGLSAKIVNSHECLIYQHLELFTNWGWKSDWFQVSHGVRRGNLTAPYLFVASKTGRIKVNSLEFRVSLENSQFPGVWLCPCPKNFSISDQSQPVPLPFLKCSSV